MNKKQPFDYGDFPIKKLPPGAAYGADDLTRWSLNRSLGRWGSGSPETKALKLKCKKCGGISEVIGTKRGTKVSGLHSCRHCESKSVKVLKPRKKRKS